MVGNGSGVLSSAKQGGHSDEPMDDAAMGVNSQAMCNASNSTGAANRVASSSGVKFVKNMGSKTGITAMKCARLP